MGLASSLTDRIGAARTHLQEAGQEQVLHFLDQLDHAGQDNLLTQIESIDWPEIARLIESHVLKAHAFEIPGNLEPAPWYPHEPPPEMDTKFNEAHALGDQLLQDGKVAAFTVAGGQGTRLGWPGPKGTFPATPVRKLPLFGCLAEYLLKVERKFGRPVPWYIMTSPSNHEDTRAFFDEHDRFGLHPDQIMMFSQAMMPALDARTGKVLLDSPQSMALSPDGHGGSLKALYAEGAIEDMKNRGIEQISYTQIDNPIVKVIDPLFIGLHALDDAQMSSKMLPKAFPRERLGNFCLVDGKMSVIEYIDLPDILADERLQDGELRFRAGSIAIHVVRVDFVESLNHGREGFALPFHRAEKSVPFIELVSGRKINPGNSNAIKLETFVFDALPLCDTSIILEADRIEEFAPIKNADGDDAVDCPSTSKNIQIERAARWLESRGVQIPRDSEGNIDAVIEIRPTTAIEPADLEDIELPARIERRAKILL